MFKVSLYVHWHIAYLCGKACILSHKAAYYRPFHWKMLTVKCHVMCAPLWTSARSKALHFSSLVKASKTRLKWSKALKYETGATLIKVVIFNSILSSVSSLLRFYLIEIEFFSPHLIFLFTLHIGLFHLRFHVYFLSFFPLLAFYKLRLPCFVFICHLSFLSYLFSYNFLSLSFFTVYLNFGPLFSLRVKFNCLLSVNFLWVSWFTPLFAEASWLQTYPDKAEFSYAVPSLFKLHVSAFCNFARDAKSIRVVQNRIKE